MGNSINKKNTLCDYTLHDIKTSKK
jgi:hypothetical protein